MNYLFQQNNKVQLPYRRKYNGAVLMCGKSLRCRYIQIFCSKTAVLIKFFLKKWTFCQKSAVLFKFPPRCRNNQDCRSIYADTVLWFLLLLLILLSEYLIFDTLDNFIKHYGRGCQCVHKKPVNNS